MNAFNRQTMQVLYTWVISLSIKRKCTSCNTITCYNILLSLHCFIQLRNRQCAIVFNWELQMKLERKPIKVWSSLTPTSISQMPKKTSSVYRVCLRCMTWMWQNSLNMDSNVVFGMFGNGLPNQSSEFLW